MLLLLCWSLAACSGPQWQVRPADVTTPALTADAMIMPDGYRLPLRRWLPPDSPGAVVLALHGFNDYSNAFATTAQYLNRKSVALYAIDQRGFGESAQRGLWAGHGVIQADLVTAATLLCAEYPDTPLYLLGESMGGAVILGAASSLHATCTAGVILAAPAVWGWQTMPWWQRYLLRLAAHVMPAYRVTGEGLDIRPSDNIEMLRALGRDPLVIKATRIDTIYGLTDLMEQALTTRRPVHVPLLLLYGEHDEIIPPRPTCLLVKRLADGLARDWRMLLYPEGYHMLTRDLQAGVVHADMAAWIGDRKTRFPSGQEVRPGNGRLARLCR